MTRFAEILPLWQNFKRIGQKRWSYCGKKCFTVGQVLVVVDGYFCNLITLHRNKIHKNAESSNSTKLTEYPSSVTRLGDLESSWWTKFLAKVAQIFSKIFMLLWKEHFLYYPHLDTFWAVFGKNWANFYSTIWSHWISERPNERTIKSDFLDLFFFQQICWVRFLF